ncbi:MAG TPA: ChbG/HpnK family deacetylase [Solirubrobacteraceae bacterium]
MNAPEGGATRLLVVNADDLGMSPGVNEGIVDAHANGIVTSASLMVNRPGAEHAAGLLETHPALSVGLHFEEDEVSDLDDPAQAEELFAAQLERFRELTGSEPTHVDSHHHVHSEDERLELFRALAEPLGVPVRHDGRVAYIGGFWAQWEVGVTNLGYIRRPFLVHLIANEATGRVTELACHPAKVTGDFRSSYLEERAVELATLTEPGLQQEIEALGITLVGFRDVDV